MLPPIILFLILAIIAGALGFSDIKGLTIYVMRIIFVIFIVLFAKGLSPHIARILCAIFLILFAVSVVANELRK